MTELDVDQPPWYPLAAEALRLAVRGELGAAHRTIEQLLAQHGPDAVPEAMCGWADAVLAYLPPAPPETTIVLVPLDQDSGKPVAANEICAPAAWASQLIAARAADDEPMFRALVDSVPSDREYSVRVSAMLMTCAANVRHAKARGMRPVHRWPIGGRS